MKFLSKNDNSEIVKQGLKYKENNPRNNSKIRDILIKEQKGFCAYTEKYIDGTTSIDIEHFDGTKKYKEVDNYYNWYAVLHWLNLRKAKDITKFNPFLLPYHESVKSRINFGAGVYYPVDQADVAAQNFIDYLGLNKPALYQERRKSVERVKFLLDNLGTDLFKEFLKNNKSDLSYITALEAELGIDLSDLI